MDIKTEKYEDLLIKCLDSRNELQFGYILDELKINPGKQLKCFKGLSTFEKVLSIPNMRRFIEICINHGSDFYKKNDNGIYPLYYTIDSLSAENLQAILLPPKDLYLPSNDYRFIPTQYSNIINEKFDGGNNYLHILINKITEENYREISQMIEMMLKQDCSASSANENEETPFYLILKNPLVENYLISFFIDNTNKIDYNSYKSDEITRFMEERGLLFRMTQKIEFLVNIDFMTEHLGDWNKAMFDKNLEILEKLSHNFQNDLVILLERAIIRNLPDVVSTLMTYGVRINDTPRNSRFNLPSAFLASTFGHHQVLKVLLSEEKCSLQSDTTTTPRNLLHQIFYFERVDCNDRQKCFDLIIADRRCTLEIINQTDGLKHVPLYLSCKYGCDEITKELLRHGAYIGYESVLNYIRKDVLEEFLDDCVKCSSDINDRYCEIYIDYKCLKPPPDQSKLETTAAYLISTNSIRTLILHPVIASFVLLKWRKINFIVYFNVLIYFSFMLFLGYTIIKFYSVFDEYDIDQNYCDIAIEHSKKHFFDLDWEQFRTYSDNDTNWLLVNFNSIKRYYENQNFNHSDINRNFEKYETFLCDEQFKNHFQQYSAQYWPLYTFAVFGIIIVAIYETLQCSMSWKKYFFKITNWLDILLISLAFVVLILNVAPNYFSKTCAVMVLVMGARSIQLFSKVSLFSLSLHMAILKKVCRTFLKTILPYLVVMLAFGMSFYALHFRPNSEKTVITEGFSGPFLSTISTVRMMLSDFGAVIVQKKEYFKGTILLGFMIAISIIVFNLLNALAISDTHGMMEVAELVETKRRISSLRTYETSLSRFKVTRFNLFPKVTAIMLTPNSHNAIKIKNSCNQMTCNVTIFMQKTKEAPKFEFLYEDRFFWQIYPDPATFDEKFITKILEFAKNQQRKIYETEHLNKNELRVISQVLIELEKKLNNHELRTMRLAQEDISRDLKSLQIYINNTNRNQEILESDWR